MCDGCAERDEIIQTLGLENEGLHSMVRRAAHDQAKARRELAAFLSPDENPENETVSTLLHLWRDVHHDGSKRVGIGATTTRAKQVRAWLKKPKWDEERITAAIMGATLDDWAMGRDSRTKGRRFNDVEKHILKDDESAERFEGLWLARDNPGKVQGTGAPPAAGHVAHRARLVPVGDDPLPVILSRLEGVKPAGQDEWSARCPAHDDRNASMSVGRGKEAVVASCHAGCQFEAIAAAIRIPVPEWFYTEDAPRKAKPALKVAQADPLPSEAQLEYWHDKAVNSPKLHDRLRDVKGWLPLSYLELGVGWDPKEKRLTIPIRDPSGALLNVVRYLPGGKPKSLALPGRPRSLFPAPEHMPGTEVWLVEGEPDAITGRQLGLNAVAVPGVNGFKKDHAGRLRGRDVVICCDSDREGREARWRWADALEGAARSVTVLDLAPDREDGYDLTDAMRDGVTVEQMRGMVVAPPGLRLVS